jgi:hypothetical protein
MWLFLMNRFVTIYQNFSINILKRFIEKLNKLSINLSIIDIKHEKTFFIFIIKINKSKIET